MTLLELKHKYLTELDDLYPENEIRSFFKILSKHRLNFSSVDTALQPDFKIEQHDLDFFLHAFAELKQEKPLQYILGETEFYGLPFKVTKDTLIPRPETEELVTWILAEFKQKAKNKSLHILDIGTGSGCIAISLAKHLPGATVFALDIAQEALEVAKQNAQLNEVTINFIEGNILDSNISSSLSKQLSKDQKFDLIVSNPPYVRETEKEEIQNNVLKYEPTTALFVTNENALIFYDKIADFARQNLLANGQLFFEINQYLAVETEQLLKDKSFTNTVLKKDSFGNYRMLKGKL
jgi:release factor glutamine methyltransferase